MSFTLIGKHEKDSRNNRDGYVTAMLDLMEKDSKVMHVDCDLENCINTGKLAKAFPEQTVNAGIAEANAMGVAAGLAATGRTVFMHSFGCFASRRAFDQAFMSAACRYTLSVPTPAYALHTTAVPTCRSRTALCTCPYRKQLLSTRLTSLRSTA